MKALLLALVWLLLWGAGLGAPPDANRYLIIFGIDGLVPDYYWRAESLGLKVPHLRALMSQGGYAEGVEGVLPTVTFPSNATLVTGAHPARHGIYYNTPFDPTGANQGGWYWYSQDLKVKTLWDVAREAGLTTAALDWPVTAGASIDYNIPEIWRASTAEDAKLVRLLSTPSLVAELEARFGRIPTPYYSTDEQRGEVAAYVVEKKKPNVSFIYFSDLDASQHEHGPYTPQAYETLEMIDRQIGRVIEASRAAGIYEKAVFAVTSDHGFETIRKRFNPSALFRQLGLIQLGENGRVVDWKAAMHGPAVVLKDPQDKRTLELVKRTLTLLADYPELGVGRVVEREEIGKQGGFPEAVLLIEPAPGFSIGGSPQGNLLEPARGGTHGLPASLPSMRASFILAGPGVRKGAVLKTARMIDIAPTLAFLLGLTLPQADGTPITGILVPMTP